MFNIEEREFKLNVIINYFSSYKETLAILLLGSGVYGFKDAYSDIDVSIIVGSIKDAKKLFLFFNEKIKQENPLIYGNIYKENSHYLVIVVDNKLLEINVSICNINGFNLKKEFKVLYLKPYFDLSKLVVNEKLKIDGLAQFIKDKEYIEHSVYFLKHALILSLRQDYINASIYLDKVRNLIITIYGLKVFGKLVDKNEIIKFDETFISNYQKTLISVFNKTRFLTVIDYTYKFLLSIINDEKVSLSDDNARYHLIYQKYKEIILLSEEYDNE